MIVKVTITYLRTSGNASCIQLVILEYCFSDITIKQEIYIPQHVKNKYEDIFKTTLAPIKSI